MSAASDMKRASGTWTRAPASIGRSYRVRRAGVLLMSMGNAVGIKRRIQAVAPTAEPDQEWSLVPQQKCIAAAK